MGPEWNGLRAYIRKNYGLDCESSMLLPSSRLSFSPPSSSPSSSTSAVFPYLVSSLLSVLMPWECIQQEQQPE